MLAEAALESPRELIHRSHLVFAEGHAHPALRELDCERRGDGQTIGRNVDQKEISWFDWGLGLSELRDRVPTVRRDAIQIEVQRQSSERALECLGEPSGLVGT